VKIPVIIPPKKVEVKTNPEPIKPKIVNIQHPEIRVTKAVMVSKGTDADPKLLESFL